MAFAAVGCMDVQTMRVALYDLGLDNSDKLLSEVPHGCNGQPHQRSISSA
jgi:hypothetical protein